MCNWRICTLKLLSKHAVYIQSTLNGNTVGISPTCPDEAKTKKKKQQK